MFSNQNSDGITSAKLYPTTKDTAFATSAYTTQTHTFLGFSLTRRSQTLYTTAKTSTKEPRESPAG